jgi:hypothetical protein
VAKYTSMTTPPEMANRSPCPSVPESGERRLRAADIARAATRL